jgi:ABC-2 type transport system permease protein
MVNSFRYGILGVSDIDIGFAFAMIIGFIVVLGGVAIHLLNTGKGIRE